MTKCVVPCSGCAAAGARSSAFFQGGSPGAALGPGAGGVDQRGAGGEIVGIEQALGHGDEVAVGHVEVAVGEGELAGLEEEMGGGQARSHGRQVEMREDAEHLAHGQRPRRRRPHAADLDRRGRAGRPAVAP